MPKETKSTEYLRQVIHDRIPDAKGVSLTFVRADLPSGRTWFLQVSSPVSANTHMRLMHLSEELAWDFDLEDDSGNQSS